MKEREPQRHEGRKETQRRNSSCISSRFFAPFATLRLLYFIFVFLQVEVKIAHTQ
jgi:hypothetical protein